MIKSLSGIRDVDLKILEELDDKDLFNFCLTSRYGKKLCENEDFWRSRFVKRFGEHPKLKERTWKNFYLALIYYLDKYNDENQSMEEASEGGMKNIDIINYFISKGANNWNMGMYFAARGGHRDLVDFFISKGARNWNYGLEGAALKGHRDLVDFFISKGSTDWNLGMYNAAKGGRRDLVELLVSKGANNLNMGMYAAAKGGHRDLVDFFINKGARNWGMAKLFAEQGGHRDLVEFFNQKIKGSNR